MTTINNNQQPDFDPEHEERLQRCAELGQIVPINKGKILRHYQGMVNEVRGEAAANVHA